MPAEWRARAACAGHPDPDLWFNGHPTKVAEAQRICAACPVRAECRQAGKDEYRGVWGGQRVKNAALFSAGDYIGQASHRRRVAS